MNYYYLVAGLADLHPEEQKHVPALESIQTELPEFLTSGDLKLFRLLFATNDNHNLIQLIHNPESAALKPGNLSKNDWDVLLASKPDDDISDLQVFPYITGFLRADKDKEIVEKGITAEDYLADLFYAFAMKCGNQFLSNWFEFNMNMNNMLVALACKKHNLDPGRHIIGHNDVARTLRHSHSRDMGIKNLFDYYDQVIRIAEEPDLTDREKKSDALRWAWLEEHAFFHYFSIEKILTYVLKVQMLERWKILSFEQGSAVFRELLESLTQGIEIKS